MLIFMCYPLIYPVRMPPQVASLMQGQHIETIIISSSNNKLYLPLLVVVFSLSLLLFLYAQYQNSGLKQLLQLPVI